MKNLNVISKTLIGLATLLILTNSALNLSLMRENVKNTQLPIIEEVELKENEEQNDENIVYNNIDEEDAFYTDGEMRMLNINIASKDQFMLLEGIDEELANSIMEYRTQISGFITCDEIKKVQGMSDDIYNKIKYEITIKVA